MFMFMFMFLDRRKPPVGNGMVGWKLQTARWDDRSSQLGPSERRDSSDDGHVMSKCRSNPEGRGSWRKKEVDHRECQRFSHSLGDLVVVVVVVVVVVGVCGWCVGGVWRLVGLNGESGCTWDTWDTWDTWNTWNTWRKLMAELNFDGTCMYMTVLKLPVDRRKDRTSGIP